MWCYERKKERRRRKKEESRDKNSPKAFGELIINLAFNDDVFLDRFYKSFLNEENDKEEILLME